MSSVEKITRVLSVKMYERWNAQFSNNKEPLGDIANWAIYPTGNGYGWVYLNGDKKCIPF